MCHVKIILVSKTTKLYRLHETHYTVVCECQITPYKIRGTGYIYTLQANKIAAALILLVTQLTQSAFLEDISLFNALRENITSVEKVFKCNLFILRTEFLKLTKPPLSSTKLFPLHQQPSHFVGFGTSFRIGKKIQLNENCAFWNKTIKDSFYIQAICCVFFNAQNTFLKLPVQATSTN